MKNHRPYVNFLRKEEHLLNTLSGLPPRHPVKVEANPRPVKIELGIRVSPNVIRVSR